MSSPQQTTARTPVSVGSVVLAPPTIQGTAPVGQVGRSVVEAATSLSPIMSLAGTNAPFLVSPVTIPPGPSPVQLLTENQFLEESLSLDTYRMANGQTVLDVGSLRGEIISMMSYSPIYDNQGANLTPFGVYFDDLHQSSLVRDTVRKYLVANNASSLPLSQISDRVTGDMRLSETSVGGLDSLVSKVGQINAALNAKAILDLYNYSTPNIPLSQFLVSRLLFSEASYNNFSDTKVLYQLLADLSGILSKCSFNLLDGFTDEDRRVNATAGAAGAARQDVQDSNTVDLTYGSNLRFTPDAIRLKYVTTAAALNTVLGSLPDGSRNRGKFIINLLSREMKVSKALGKTQNLDPSGFFGIQRQGNPFDNVVGSPPADIFLQPSGRNSLSTLFYIKTDGDNVVILPFEARQVVGDNETVFLAGPTWFSDSVLRGDFGVYNRYREQFSTRVANAKALFDKTLLDVARTDATSAPLEPQPLLRNILGVYGIAQGYVRKDNNDPTTLLTFVMFLAASSDQALKFELFKLLLLIILNDSRPSVTQMSMVTDDFRRLLYSELSQQPVDGFDRPVTEGSVPTLLSSQIETVKRLVLLKARALSSTTSTQQGPSQRRRTGAAALVAQMEQLGVDQGTSSSPNAQNTTANVAPVQLEQFSRLDEALRGEQNLLRCVMDVCKGLFTACSTANTTYHLVDNSSVTRFNGMTLTTTILLVFELFGALVEQFAQPVMSYTLSAAGPTQHLQLGFAVSELGAATTSIRQYVAGGAYTNDIISDYDRRLGGELDIVRNIFTFFETLNSRLGTVSDGPSQTELSALTQTRALSANTLGSTRLAKSILRSFADKRRAWNPTSRRELDFYLPAGKLLTDSDYRAMKIALAGPTFRTSHGRGKLLTVGIPRNFTSAALGAKLNKADTTHGALVHDQTTDLVQVSVHKIDRHDTGVIYKPKTFLFDLSLFSKGFGSYFPPDVSALSYDSLPERFEFYDFGEGQPYSHVSTNVLGRLVRSEQYYVARPDLAREVVENLFRSYVLGMYQHTLTGLSSDEETFIDHSETESSMMAEALSAVIASSTTRGATPDLFGVKNISPEYGGLLQFFHRRSLTEYKLMLSLCNDIRASVFRQKQYDRTFNLFVDVDSFEIDATQTGVHLMSALRHNNKLVTDPQTGAPTKVHDEFIMDQYFINIELVK